MKIIHIKKFLTGKFSWQDIKDYFRANIRYKLYYSSKFGFMLPDHIGEQINMRIVVMDSECYNTGSCKHCGCKTTNLQMANKSCEGLCYPPIMDSGTWKAFKNGYVLNQKVDNDKSYYWFIKNGKLEYKIIHNKYQNII